jgi:hypothetical protein
VLQNLRDFYTLFRLIGHHPHKQVLEVFREEVYGFVLGVRSPEGLVVLFLDSTVEGVGYYGFLERRCARVHNEQNHPARKYVYFRPTVFT